MFEQEAAPILEMTQGTPRTKREDALAAPIHEAVKNYFATISIGDLFLVASEQLIKKRANRFMGKRAYNKLLVAQAARRKSGRTPYFPENIRL